jgi:hypothetical protein
MSYLVETKHGTEFVFRYLRAKLIEATRTALWVAKTEQTKSRVRHEIHREIVFHANPDGSWIGNIGYAENYGDGKR